MQYVGDVDGRAIITVFGEGQGEIRVLIAVFCEGAPQWWAARR